MPAKFSGYTLFLSRPLEFRIDWATPGCLAPPFEWQTPEYQWNDVYYSNCQILTLLIQWSQDCNYSWTGLNHNSLWSSIKDGWNSVYALLTLVRRPAWYIQRLNNAEIS